MDLENSHSNMDTTNILFPLKKTSFLDLNLNCLWSKLIIEELVNKNSKYFFLSPGMRNAPLLWAVNNQENAKYFIGIDERSSSFRALGLSKTSGVPSVLICTSGSALAHYYPAIIEAFKSGVPLIIISADRPVDMVLSGHNQTINQSEFFLKYCKYSINLGTPSEEISPHLIKKEISYLIHQSVSGAKGPTHINLSFREPFFTKNSPISTKYLDEFTIKKSTGTSFQEGTPNLPPPLPIQLILNNLSQKTFPLLVIGELPPWEDLSPLYQFLKNWKGHFLLDVTSGLKFNLTNFKEGQERLVPSFDHPEVYQEFIKNPPDFILHLGGRLTSKFYYKFQEVIRDFDGEKDISNLVVNYPGQRNDPGSFYQNEWHISPSLFCLEVEKQKLLFSCPNTIESKFSLWNSFIKKKISAIDNAPLTFPVISKNLIDLLPSDSSLYLGNSTTIRSFDSYSFHPEFSRDIKNIKVLTHRGASGIEGLISAACGAALFDSAPLTVVLGDLSLIHDLNSLYLLKEIQKTIIIILVNNGGGGIFTLLPQPQNLDILPMLTTPHQETFEWTEKAFQINYKKVISTFEFQHSYLKALSIPGPTLIEAQIDDKENQKIYQKLRTIKL